ncbi:NfeD family protein [Pseudaeromonas sp. ZJS20]
MSELLHGWSHWHWLILGCLLLVLELLGTAGLLLWTGLAALLVGLISWVVPMGTTAQWLLFAVAASLTTFAWWRIQHGKDSEEDSQRTLNQRMSRYLGRQTRLLQAVENGSSRIKLDDTVWPVRCEQALAAGVLVKVVAADSICLTVEPVAGDGPQ